MAVHAQSVQENRGAVVNPTPRLTTFRVTSGTSTFTIYGAAFQVVA